MEPQTPYQPTTPAPPLAELLTHEQLLGRIRWRIQMGWSINEFYAETLLAAYDDQRQALERAQQSRAYGSSIINDQQLELDGLSAMVQDAIKELTACNPEGEEVELREALAGALESLTSSPELIGTEVVRDERSIWPDAWAVGVSREEFLAVWEKMRPKVGQPPVELTREESLIYSLGKVYWVVGSYRETIERRGQMIQELRRELQLKTEKAATTE